MSDGEQKTINFRTSPEFVKQYRALDQRAETLSAQEKAHIQAGDAANAGKTAAEYSTLVNEIRDLIYDEMERHWGARLLEDNTLPEVPDDWTMWVSGRLMRVVYHGREVFEDR
ncbi:MAG: hypothetical protein IT463_14860 [Planctomycetes bacterium]|nr:hypothetical protein [Planctomycetota bacterium]